mgnify:CR=1 FL=1
MKCCDMKAGDLREPVEIQKQVKVDIGGGATSITWQKRLSTKGKMVPISGRERIHADRLDAVTKNRLIIRYTPEVVEADRAVIRGRAYQIRYINNLEFKNRWLEIDLDGGEAQ